MIPVDLFALRKDLAENFHIIAACFTASTASATGTVRKQIFGTVEKENLNHTNHLLQPKPARSWDDIAWQSTGHGQDGKVFAKELRELTAYNVAGGRLIEFASKLAKTAGKVRLDGDPQHAGFSFAVRKR